MWNTHVLGAKDYCFHPKMLSWAGNSGSLKLSWASDSLGPPMVILDSPPPPATRWPEVSQFPLLATISWKATPGLLCCHLISSPVFNIEIQKNLENHVNLEYSHLLKWWLLFFFFCLFFLVAFPYSRFYVYFIFSLCDAYCCNLFSSQQIHRLCSGYLCFQGGWDTVSFPAAFIQERLSDLGFQPTSYPSNAAARVWEGSWMWVVQLAMLFLLFFSPPASHVVSICWVCFSELVVLFF